MPINEKRVLSLRYIWQMFVYALDGCLLIMAFAMAECLFRISRGDCMDVFFSRISGGGTHVGGELKIMVFLMALVCAAVFTGAVIALWRFTSFDLYQRNEVRRLLSALGYRKWDIVVYEEMYVLFDIVCSFVLSVVMINLLWLMVRKHEVIALFCEALNRKSLLSIASCVFSFSILLLSVMLLTYRQVRTK